MTIPVTCIGCGAPGYVDAIEPGAVLVCESCRAFVEAERAEEQAEATMSRFDLEPPRPPSGIRSRVFPELPTPWLGLLGAYAAWSSIFHEPPNPDA